MTTQEELRFKTSYYLYLGNQVKKWSALKSQAKNKNLYSILETELKTARDKRAILKKYLDFWGVENRHLINI